jgi:hypothetical protein
VVSRQRAIARAQREVIARDRAATAAAERERLALEHARRERRALIWRRMRLWQSRPTPDHRREKRAVLAAFVFVLLVLTYLFTGSLGAVFVVVLVLAISAPVLAMVFFDRSKR